MLLRVRLSSTGNPFTPAHCASPSWQRERLRPAAVAVVRGAVEAVGRGHGDSQREDSTTRLGPLGGSFFRSAVRHVTTPGRTTTTSPAQPPIATTYAPAGTRLADIIPRCITRLSHKAVWTVCFSCEHGRRTHHPDSVPWRRRDWEVDTIGVGLFMLIASSLRAPFLSCSLSFASS